MKARILVVDDELPLQRAIRQALELEGHLVRTAGSAEEAFSELRKSVPDMVLLDVRLPDMTGFDICHKIRATPEWKGVGIIFLTSKTEEVSRVMGLELGGDDYVGKPFSAVELMARVKAVMRRRNGTDEEETLESPPLKVEPSKREARVGGTILELTAKEFDFLCALLRKKGRVLSRALLMETVWGREDPGTTRTIDTHVYSLRKKLGNLGTRIVAVGKMGYKWEDPE
jgi:DNA-binding response OmpR family regulator